MGKDITKLSARSMLYLGRSSVCVVWKVSHAKDQAEAGAMDYDH